MKSNTAYRTKLRAVFLAAIMITSVVGMSVAFTGAAAAMNSVNYPDGDNPYQGQTITITNGDLDSNTEYDLRVVNSYDDSDTVQSSSSVRDVFSDGSSVVEIDTSDLEAGDYFLTGGNLQSASDVEQGDTFEVRLQALTAEFDDELVTSSGQDSTTELDLDSNRGTYSTNVSADGDLSDDDLIDIFINNDTLAAVHKSEQVKNNVTFGGVDTTPQLQNGIGNFDTALENEINALVQAEESAALNQSVADLVNSSSSGGLDFTQGTVDVEAGDFGVTADYASNGGLSAFVSDYSDENPFRAFAFNEDEDDADEQIVLIGDRGLDILDSDTEADVSFAGIDEGDYSFEFNVADTEASASADITVREEDVDGAFSQGVYQSTAGDIVEFTLELEDTDEAWIQIGDGDAGYLDVIYVVDDDETGEVTFQMNTRLAGTDASTAEVYFSDDDEIVASAVHDFGGDFGDLEARFQNDDNEGKSTGNADGGETEDDFIAYLQELDLLDSGEDDPLEQLTRPIQPTDYELTASADGIFIADNGGSEADDELDSALLELQVPMLGDIVTHVASSDDANDDDELEDLLNVVTERSDIALEDRLVVQVEATGLYGAMASVSDAGDNGFALFEDGTSGATIGELNDLAGEGIELTIESEETTGNQDPTEVDFSNDNEDEIFVIVDRDGGQFFVIINTDADDAFNNGAPEDGDTFTATLEYNTDDDDRYSFPDGAVGDAFSGGADGNNNDDAYPYFRANSDASTSAEIDFEERMVTFDNLNADDEIQAENIEDSEISGETNIAPGSPAEIRVASTDAASSFRMGQAVDINSNGEISITFDFSGQEVGDEFDTRFRTGGSGVDTVASVIVEEGTLSVADPVDDEEPADDTDDVVDEDDDVVDDEDDTVDETDDETPGFGVLVALLAILSAALLATRRQK